MTVLIAEDDEIIAEGLRYSLLQEGNEVLIAPTYHKASEIISGRNNIDFFLLDVMLPDGNGFDLCEFIRRSSDTPVIFLTACDDETSTVRALESGADDYIAKPFRIRELFARMKAVMRRSSGKKSDQGLINIGRNVLNITSGKLYRDNEEVVLTAMEYKLLLIFVNNRGIVLSRSAILDNIWDEAGDYVNDNTLTVYIKRLRNKLGESEQLIETVRGIGYRMK